MTQKCRGVHRGAYASVTIRPLFSLLSLVAAAATAATASGSDWPRYRGSDGNGASPETGLLRTWPPDGPAVAWTVSLNPGYSGATVRDGFVYVMDREPRVRESVICLNLKSGREVWRCSYARQDALRGFDGSRHPPTVDTNLLFAVGALGDLTAINRSDGATVWRTDLVSRFQTKGGKPSMQLHVPQWGYSQCPVVFGDTVIVAPFATNAGLVALDKATGAERWRSAGIGLNDFSHVTPELMILGDLPQVLTIAIMQHGKNPPALLSSVDPQTGDILWQTRTKSSYNVPIPQPLRIGSNTVFYTGGYRIGAFLLDVRRTGSEWRSEQTLANESNCTAHIQSPVFYRGHIYAQSFDSFQNSTNNGMVCMKTDLSLCWRSSDRGILFDSGPFLVADGMIFVLHGDTGELFLLDADPAAFKVLSRAKVLDARGGKAWAPMALSNGRLLLRDQTTMKCLIVSSGDAP